MALTPLNAKYAKCNNPIIERAKYKNGRLALTVKDGNTGEDICVASVNIPDALILDNEVAIKDYSENEGILAWLIENNIVKKPHAIVHTGYVTVEVCEAIK